MNYSHLPLGHLRTALHLTAQGNDELPSSVDTVIYQKIEKKGEEVWPGLVTLDGDQQLNELIFLGKIGFCV